MSQQYQNYFFNFILAVIAFILVMLVITALPYALRVVTDWWSDRRLEKRRSRQEVIARRQAVAVQSKRHNNLKHTC